MAEYVAEKINGYTFKLPKRLVDDFKTTAYVEGYSMQDALILLMERYVNGQ